MAMGNIHESFKSVFCLFCVHLMGELVTLWGVCGGQRKILSSRLSFYLVVLGIKVRPSV